MRIRRALSARLEDERGFTLMEVMVAIVIGLLVVLAADQLLEQAVTQSGGVQDRVDSAERARLAMDEITRELDSQVCMQAGSPAVTYGDDTSVTFYDFMGPGSFVPEKRTITFSGGTITDAQYAGSGAPPSTTFPAQPTSVRTLVTNVTASGSTPIFTYYTYPSTNATAPTVKLLTPLSAADQLNVARVQVEFTARANKRSDLSGSTDIQDDAFVRGWDPNTPGGPTGPECL